MRHAVSIAAGLAARGLALVLGGFLLLGVVGEVRGRATDLSLWLVDVRDLSTLIAWPLLAATAGALIAWAVSCRPSRVRRWLGAGAAVTLALLAVRDAVRYRDAVALGDVRPAAPFPLSLALVIILVILAAVVIRDVGLSIAGAWPGRAAVLASTALFAAAFPIAQIAFFGTTDYRRPAEAAVVLGARVYANGSPSPLLADRIAAGVELYRSGLVPLLVMSGGDGADGWNEADVMRERAIAAGVPAQSVLVDRTGVNTDATVAHTIELLGGPSSASASHRIMAVSQAYHLPRIQLAFSAAGVDVITVPALDPVPIQETPLLMAREIPAFWAYYLTACLGG